MRIEGLYDTFLFCPRDMIDGFGCLSVYLCVCLVFSYLHVDTELRYMYLACSSIWNLDSIVLLE